VTTKPLPRLRLLSCGFIIAAGALSAQTTTEPANAAGAPTPVAAAGETEEIIELSPFVISADKGWSANDTLSANRTRQALKDVPVAIDAVTSDFIADLGFGTADSVMNFVAGVYAPSNIENDGQQDVLAFRGLNQRGNASRNYFRWYAPSDTYNVERIDFGKGSNSLIFGEIEPGGQASVFTKRAIFRNFGKVEGGYNSEGAYRAQIDINRKLTDQVAVRVNAVKREERTYQDASTFGLEGITGTLTWKPFKNTTIRLDGEIGDFENARGFGSLSVRERSARTLGFSNGVTYTSDGDWVRSQTATNGVPNTYVTASGRTILAQQSAAGRDFARGPAGGSPSLYEGGFVDVTMLSAASGAVVGTRRFNGLPKHYNIRGSFDKQARPFNTYTVTVEQKLGPVDVEVAYNHQNQQADRTDNFFSNTISLDVNGRPYIDSTLDIKRFGTETDAFRALASYKFDKWDWTEQTLVLSGEYTEEQFENVRWQYYNVRPVEKGLQTGIDATHDRARLRIYLDDPQFYSRALFDRMRPNRAPATDDVKILPLRFIGSGGGAMDGTQWRQAAAFSASLSGKYLQNKLNTLVGFRRDFNRLWEYDIPSTREGTYGEEPFPPKREDAAPGQYVQNASQRGAVTTFSTGASYAITQNINIYAAYGESFRFQDILTFDLVRLGPISGESKEVGFKGDFWDRKATFSIGFFEIDRINSPRSYNGIEGLTFDRADAELLMNRTLDTTAPGYRRANDLTASAARYVNSVENSRGFDATLAARPVEGLQLRFTLAHADVTSDTDVSNLRRYYTDALNDPNFLGVSTTSAQVLSEAKIILDTFSPVGRSTGARAAEWSASWVVDYDFSALSFAPLKNIRAGINGSWRDDYLFAISNGQKLVGGSQHMVNAYLMRDQRIFGYKTRIRVGARNFFDIENGKLRKTGFTTMNDGTNVYRYSYVEPVQYDVTLTFNF
jgi:outer membrane receptor protein involved in Fe transport